jgi:hypothetical protein
MAYLSIVPNAIVGDGVCIHIGGVAATDCKDKCKTVHSETAFTPSESLEWLNSRRKTTLEGILVQAFDTDVF